MTKKQLDIIASKGLTEADFKPSDNNDKLSVLMDLISIDRVQSDKLGFDFEVIRVGDMEVRKAYKAQLNPTGTTDNPIIYSDGVALINNAYYLKDGIRQVYMDGQWVEF